MIYDKQQAQLRKIFGDTETSPAGLSYKMLGESKYINESVLQYIINYIIIFGTRDIEHLPPYLHDTATICNELYQHLAKVGLTNAGSRQFNIGCYKKAKLGPPHVGCGGPFLLSQTRQNVRFVTNIPNALYAIIFLTTLRIG